MATGEPMNNEINTEAHYYIRIYRQELFLNLFDQSVISGDSFSLRASKAFNILNTYFIIGVLPFNITEYE